MVFALPQLHSPLTSDQLLLIQAFSKSCRRSILEMTHQAQSGHPGGSLSSIDYLAVLYAFVISQTGEKVVVSNGHISPAVYSVLAELGYVSKDEVNSSFRKVGSIFEGHVTRHVAGVEYGTGPLGIGVSVAAGFALAEKLKNSERNVYALMGDGEAQEGQVHEMIHFAAHHHLDNLILFVDANKVQLTASLADILPLDLRKLFEAAGWKVLEVDAHNPQALWATLGDAHSISGAPVVLIGHSVMGKGVEFMEPEGLASRATWHGSAPKTEQVKPALNAMILDKAEEELLEHFRAQIQWHPKPAEFPKLLSPLPLDTGTPFTYAPDAKIDCRTAYGKALLDLAQRNPSILALTADLRGSVMTKFVYENLPKQHVECGIAEQHMVSLSGGLSLSGFTPFCSTFGAFMTSRAKDQARVNDINHTNVKMVATHCGLSVGEDGPTHQAIDDMGSFVGLLHTMVIEPADPNQTDRIIRYVASHYGNFYVRMGRHAFPILTKEDGTPFYDESYEYTYGRCDVIRPGNQLTLAASGALVSEAVQARELLLNSHPELSIEIVAVSSLKQFDDILKASIRKTGRVLTLEDHNILSGLGSQLGVFLLEKKIAVKQFERMGVLEYQLSGTWKDLYHKVGLDAKGIAKRIVEMFKA
ncbi:MAG: Transketolase [Candidatus Peregrinibacteria bacterium GW2011_GWA2_44_7]|nr:MAG: Transketolase [Candidatus Peregrinibacteria bacterium GW2011_GWA2_44_7]